MEVLLTGGARYVGSHICVERLKGDHDAVMFGDFSNSNPEAIKRVEKRTGKTLTVIHGDVRNAAALRKALSDNTCEAVIHLAGLKAVGGSVELSLLGWLELLDLAVMCRDHWRWQKQKSWSYV